MSNLYLRTALVGLLVLSAGCDTLRPKKEVVNKGYTGMMSQYETFDSTQYPEKAAGTVTITNDVPDALLRPSTSTNTTPSNPNNTGGNTSANPTPGGNTNTGNNTNPNTNPPSGNTGTTTRQGYRLQVYVSGTKAGAEAFRRDLLTWWATAKNSAPASLGRGELATYIVVQDGKYKVRLGNLNDRTVADEAAAFVKRRFADAFVVPDTIIAN